LDDHTIEQFYSAKTPEVSKSSCSSTESPNKRDSHSDSDAYCFNVSRSPSSSEEDHLSPVQSQKNLNQINISDQSSKYADSDVPSRSSSKNFSRKSAKHSLHSPLSQVSNSSAIISNQPTSLNQNDKCSAQFDKMEKRKSDERDSGKFVKHFPSKKEGVQNNVTNLSVKLNITQNTDTPIKEQQNNQSGQKIFSSKVKRDNNTNQNSVGENKYVFFSGSNSSAKQPQNRSRSSSVSMPLTNVPSTPEQKSNRKSAGK
jgi:hypothetical protein